MTILNVLRWVVLVPAGFLFCFLCTVHLLCGISKVLHNEWGHHGRHAPAPFFGGFLAAVVALLFPKMDARQRLVLFGVLVVFVNWAPLLALGIRAFMRNTRESDRPSE